MFKKIFLILLLVLLPGTALAFTDVNEGNFYYVPLNYLKEKQIINGYADNTFRPMADINRAEALSMLSKAIDFEAYSVVEKPLASIKKAEAADSIDTENCKFSDVDQNDWFYKLVCKAYAQKVLQGYPDGKFHPEKYINKAEAIKVAIIHTGLPLPTEEGDNFSDISSKDWFSKYTQLAKSKTYYVERRDGTLHPAETLSRGDFALLIYRIIKNRTENSLFGRASYYHTSLEGANTSSGEAYDAEALTAAHRTLPFGTKVKVINLANGKTVTVKINDRGPYTKGFTLDLSETAFKSIANLSSGIINVEYQVISE